MHIKVLKSILKDILNHGIDTKEFQIADIEKATSAVRDATQLLVIAFPGLMRYVYKALRPYKRTSPGW